MKSLNSNLKTIVLNRGIGHLTQIKCFSSKILNEVTKNEYFDELNLLQDKSKDLFEVVEKRKDTLERKFPITTLPPDKLDWSSYWPAPRSYNATTVPLPVFQGKVKIGDKFVRKIEGTLSTELLKISNFLHLTPQTIYKQTKALKKFCTPWPTELKTDQACDIYFPFQIITQDRIHSSVSIRDVKARKVILKFNINDLQFNSEKARNKFIRLLRDKYNEKTSMVTITIESCPFKKQNLDLGLYQLTACYFESSKTEPWELEKSQYENK